MFRTVALLCMMFLLAACTDTAEKNYQLAHKYYLGEGVEKDLNRAFEHYQKAANQGHSQAQVELGFYYYYQGNSVVAQDYIKAREWFEKSALQENLLAQHNLGVIYDYGEGVEKDLNPGY